MSRAAESSLQGLMKECFGDYQHFNPHTRQGMENVLRKGGIPLFEQCRHVGLGYEVDPGRSKKNPETLIEEIGPGMVRIYAGVLPKRLRPGYVPPWWERWWMAILNFLKREAS